MAGGSGSRMKSAIPKQFIEIEKIPVIIKTINCFLNYNAAIKIIISVHAAYKRHMEDLIIKFDLRHADIKITEGGETRFYSVKNGLQLVNDVDGIVGIHDAARPFVSAKTIQNCFETAATKGNATPCVPVNDSLRKVDVDANHAVSRSDFKIIQTPQCFLVSKIKAAFEQEYNLFFTDDATVLESTGEKIILVDGNEENIKITSPHDLLIANALAKL